MRVCVTERPRSGGDVDQHLADGALLHREVRLRGLGQRVDVQGESGIRAGPDRAVEDGGVDVLDGEQ